MRNLFSLLLLLLLSVPQLKAIMANPYPSSCRQPDGSYITITLHGDEFSNFTSTEDGYTVIKNDAGYYVYANLVNGEAEPTSVIARNIDQRSDSDKKFLNSVQKNITTHKVDESTKTKATNLIASVNAQPKANNYSKFKGLVILVEYNNCAFSRSDIQDIFNNMVNQKDYTGFQTTSAIPETVKYTGSVRDYFYDNSNGKFDPQFNVVGPVKVNYSKTYINQTTNAQTLMTAAVKAADDLVNYKDFDTDGDNVVDMVYFIFAGAGSNVSGNNSALLWPHASSFYSTLRLDNVSFGRYACSTELYGAESSSVIDGIGTICHEFSHTLGLMDEYDTDYASSGGTSNHPDNWSLMASGSYLNYSRTPAGYSLFEKYSVGFSTPTLISDKGDLSLEALEASHTGYQINSAINKEYFLLENRQKIKWDSYLPGHGMLIFRVDSTSTAPWSSNKVNANPAHNYYELVRAYPSSAVASSDPFPGTGKVTSITNETTPNLKSWTGVDTPFTLYNINEDSNGVITFSVKAAETESDTEDFENMPLNTEDVTGVEGKFCKWDFTKATVEMRNSNKSVGILRNSEVKTDEIPSYVQILSFDIDNPTTINTIIRCYYSINGGSTWKSAQTFDGLESVTINANSKGSLKYNINISTPAIFRIRDFMGSSTDKCYLDNVKFVYSERHSGVDEIKSDDTSSLSIYRSGNVITMAGLQESLPVNIFTAEGKLINSLQPQGDSLEFQLPTSGFYIIQQGAKSVKLIY